MNRNRRIFLPMALLCLAGALGFFVMALVSPAGFRHTLALGASAGASGVVVIREAEGAAALYLAAIDAIVEPSPSDSGIEFPQYPPYGREWDRMAETAYRANRAVHALARRARSEQSAVWPTHSSHFNDVRRLATQLADAAMYQHLIGNNHEAIELIRDILHLARMLQEPQTEQVGLLTGAGIEAIALERLMALAPRIMIDAQPDNRTIVDETTVKALILQLLPQQTNQPGTPPANHAVSDDFENAMTSRARETLKRMSAERALVAMSLACQLFRRDKIRWPTSAEELVPHYLPWLSPDPWGDGVETYGYILIKAGLPDGGDRPMVFSRCESQEGLAAPSEGPRYGFYVADGVKNPSPRVSRLLRHGQFRDVSSWPKTAKPAVE